MDVHLESTDSITNASTTVDSTTTNSLKNASTTFQETTGLLTNKTTTENGADIFTNATTAQVETKYSFTNMSTSESSTTVLYTNTSTTQMETTPFSTNASTTQMETTSFSTNTSTSVTENATTGVFTTEPEITTVVFTTTRPDFFNDNKWLLAPIICAGLFVIGLTVFIIYKLWQKYRYDYTALEEQQALPMKLKLQQKQKEDSIKHAALINCQYYLRGNSNYGLMDQLPTLGWREDKHWFLVRENNTRTDVLLSVLPKGRKMILPFTTATRRTLKELFQKLEHPLLLPVQDMDLLMGRDHVIFLHPFCPQGSIKDLIYKSRCTSWSDIKYSKQGTPLLTNFIQLFGKQILTALMFLEEQTFPDMVNIHTGNVLVYNHICRITGYENCLLGVFPREKLTYKTLNLPQASWLSQAFGMLIYEMSAGCCLHGGVLTAEHQASVPDHEVLQILQYIFTKKTGDSQLPNIKEIYDQPFFAAVGLPKHIQLPQSPITWSLAVSGMLKTFRKSQPSKSNINQVQHQHAQDTKGSKKRKKSTKHKVKKSGSREKEPANMLTDVSIATPHVTMDIAHVNVDSEGSERTALLGDIRQGRTLRKAYTNDHSTPKV